MLCFWDSKNIHLVTVKSKILILTGSFLWSSRASFVFPLTAWASWHPNNTYVSILRVLYSFLLCHINISMSIVTLLSNYLKNVLLHYFVWLFKNLYFQIFKKKESSISGGGNYAKSLPQTTGNCFDCLPNILSLKTRISHVNCIDY